MTQKLPEAKFLLKRQYIPCPGRRAMGYLSRGVFSKLTVIYRHRIVRVRLYSFVTMNSSARQSFRTKSQYTLYVIQFVQTYELSGIPLTISGRAYRFQYVCVKRSMLVMSPSYSDQALSSRILSGGPTLIADKQLYRPRISQMEP